jgi:hypothetical protein
MSYSAPKRPLRADALRRSVLRLSLAALSLAALSAAWGYGAVYLSGRLSLAQTAPAIELPKGFDFGPVYLNEARPSRFFITATVPDSPGRSWHTSFEILDLNKRAIYKEEELRFIGEYFFMPGEATSFQKQFTLNRDSGYYYFRFSSLSGTYPADSALRPAISFAVRQNVIPDAWIAGGVAFTGLLALILFGLAISAIRRLGAGQHADGQQEPEAAPVVRQFPAQQGGVGRIARG